MLITAGNFGAYSIGAKAERLFRMQRHGIRVPELFCISEDTTESEIAAYIRQTFRAGTLFSVRSSANAEDSAAFSFAGQLDTFLFVPAEQVWEKICQCRASADSESVREYLRINGIAHEEFRIHVIVQVMVDADCAGVLFTANPQGLKPEKEAIRWATYEDMRVPAAVAFLPGGTSASESRRTLVFGFPIEAALDFDQLYRRSIHWLLEK